ncbi:unnamed protein product, partial [Ascophyllum nodosum]
DLQALLNRVAAGELPSSVAASQLSPLLVAGGAQAEEVGGFAKIDHQRRLRVGFPEVVFGEGKSASQIVDILTAMIKEHSASGAGSSPIVATRVSAEKWADISVELQGLRYHAEARVVAFGGPPPLAERPPTPSTSRGFQQQCREGCSDECRHFRSCCGGGGGLIGRAGRGGGGETPRRGRCWHSPAIGGHPYR